MDLNTAVKGILSIRERIAKAWENPVKLSDLGNKLANYNAYLGDFLGEAKDEREVMKGRAYMRHLKGGASSTAADNLSRAEVAELSGTIARLELTHRDAGVQITMIQSRLKVLENKLRGEY